MADNIINKKEGSKTTIKPGIESGTGKLVDTSTAIIYTGTTKAKFKRLRQNKVFVAHERSEQDNRYDMFYVNCLLVRKKIFELLARRKNGLRMTQARIGDILTLEFMDDDKGLKEQLLESQTVEDIVKSVTSRY